MKIVALEPVQEFFTNMPTGFSGIFAGIALVLALLQCFMGYKLLKVWITLIGGGLGLTAGIILGNKFIKHSSLTVVLALILMLLVGYLAFKVYKLGVFLLGGYTAYLLVFSILVEAAKGTFWWIYLLAGLAGILVGVLCVTLMRPVIILTTGISNGLHAGSRLMAMGGVTGQAPVLAAGIVLAAIGVVVQFMTTKKGR